MLVFSLSLSSSGSRAAQLLQPGLVKVFLVRSLTAAMLVWRTFRRRCSWDMGSTSDFICFSASVVSARKTQTRMIFMTLLKEAGNKSQRNNLINDGDGINLFVIVFPFDLAKSYLWHMGVFITTINNMVTFCSRSVRSDLCKGQTYQMCALKQAAACWSAIPLFRSLTDDRAEFRVSSSLFWISVPNWGPISGFQRRETHRSEEVMTRKRSSIPPRPHHQGFLRPPVSSCCSGSPRCWIAGDRNKA